MSKSIEYYLSVGCDMKTAEYFASGRKKIISVRPNENFTLTLDFDNGERRMYDCRPLLEEGTVFEPLMRYDDFKRVYIDDVGSVAWDIDPDIDSNKVRNNKADLCPDYCYLNSLPVSKAEIK